MEAQPIQVKVRFAVLNMVSVNRPRDQSQARKLTNDVKTGLEQLKLELDCFLIDLNPTRLSSEATRDEPLPKCS